MRICLAIFLFAIPAAAGAQLPRYHARVFDARNGLSANTISDIFKDKEDWLWVVYNYSNFIERFDGRTVEKFNFTEQPIHYLNDTSNNAWIIGATTINKLPSGASRFEPIHFDTAANERLVRIFQLPGRPVTLFSTKYFYEWDEAHQRFSRVNKPFVKPGTAYGPSLFDVHDHTIFFAGRQLYAYDYATGRADSLPATNLFSVYALSSTLAVFVRYDGLAYWADFSLKKITPLDARKYFPGERMVHFRITGVAPLADNKYLMLTTAGLMEYNIKEDRFTKSGLYADGTPFEYENFLSRLFLDKDGVAWAHAETIITALTPISKTLGLLRNKEQDPARKWNNTVTSFAEDANNNLWIGTGFGFLHLNYQSGATEVFHPVENASDRLSHESIRGILFNGRYVILAPTDRGIWLFDSKTKKYRRPSYKSDSVKNSSENDFYDMAYTDRKGNHIFPGRDGLYVMDGKTYQLRRITMPKDANFNTVIQDSAERIWIGSMSAIYCLNNTYERQFELKQVLPGIITFFETQADHYLVGTTAGLYKMDFKGSATTAEYLTTAMGHIPILSIFRDSLNHYWFSTTNGLYMSDADLSAFRKFDFSDNIQSLLYAGNAVIRTKTGMVFLGGRHGINYFRPEDFTLSDNPLTVKVKSVYTADGDTLTAEEFNNSIFAYNKRSISFNITAPYYFNTEKIQFRYILKGLTEEWTNIGSNHTISFPSLPDGKYELIVAASTNGKVWYTGKQSISFVITPPFWKRWWFILSVVLLCIGLLSYLQKRREDFLRKKEKEELARQKLTAENLQFKLAVNEAQLIVLENERKAATAKLQSMRLQMNPHFLFNALNSIQQMIMTGKEEKATLYLSKFSKLLRMVLTHSDRETVTLKEEIEMLKLYIDLEALRFEESFSYSIHIDSGIDQNDTKVPTLLIQPFVENAIWHGLLHKEGMRKLDISFHLLDSDSLQCLVTDNGIGREAARLFAKKTAQNNHTGKGVSVATERLKVFNEQNNDSSSLEIVDLKNENGESAGTKVIITLPNLS